MDMENFKFEKDDNDSGWVYICSSNNLLKKNIYKIGFTKNLKQRISALNNGLYGDDNKLRMLYQYFVLNCKEVESFLHEKYKTQRLYGEFFELSNNDIEHIGKNIYSYKINNSGNISLEIYKPDKEHDINPLVLQKFINLQNTFIIFNKTRYCFFEEDGIWRKLNKDESVAFFKKFIKKNFTNEDFNIKYALNNIKSLTYQIELDLI